MEPFNHNIYPGCLRCSEVLTTFYDKVFPMRMKKRFAYFTLRPTFNKAFNVHYGMDSTDIQRSTSLEKSFSLI